MILRLRRRVRSASFCATRTARAPFCRQISTARAASIESVLIPQTDRPGGARDRIQFDFGALKLLESELQLLGIRRPL